METIGQSLQQAREAKGLTLGDVQRITKIRTSYLEALETGAFSTLPGNVYIRAFIRTYAAGIGVDPQPFLARYENLYQEAQRQANAESVEKPPRMTHVVARHIWATVNGTMEWLGL